MRRQPPNGYTDGSKGQHGEESPPWAASVCCSRVGALNGWAAGTGQPDAMRGVWGGSPVLAGAFLVALLSLGGIPFLVGFWGKLYVFIAGIGAARPWSVPIVFLGGIFAIVALFYYLMVAKRMFSQPAGAVVVDAIYAKKGPGYAYANAFNEPLHDGLEFILLQQRSDWAHVELSDGRQCWLPIGQVQFLEY